MQPSRSFGRHDSTRATACLLALVVAGPLTAQDTGNARPPAEPTADTLEPPAPTAGIVVEETLIAEMPADADVECAVANTEHAAWVLNTQGTRAVFLDGAQVGESYDDVGCPRLFGTGAQVAWIAKRDGKWFAVADGVERTRHYGKMSELRVSPDAKSILVGACNGDHCHLVVDMAEVGPEFEEITAPAVSADGTHVMYAGKREKKWVMVIDGEERWPPMNTVEHYSFLRSTSRTLVAGSELTSSGRGLQKSVTSMCRWYIDTVAGPGFEVIGMPVFYETHWGYAGANSESVNLLSRHNTHGTIVVDGEPGEQFDGSGFGGGFKGFGATISIRTGVHDLDAAFYGVSDPIYTPDGKLVYAARIADGDVALIIDNAATSHYQNIVSPIISSRDGNHLYFVAQLGDGFVDVLDEQVGTKVPVQGTVRWPCGM